MPIVMDSTPSSAALSMDSLNPGIMVSHPSRPNLLAAVYLFERKFSNMSAHASRSKSTFLRDLLYCARSCCSIFSRSQLHWSLSEMCMYS